MPCPAGMPPWKVGQQATFELRNLRAELEHKIETASGCTCTEALQAQLDEVLAEQDARAKAEQRARTASRNPDEQ